MIETEVLVLGAGPAGVSCALECLDNKLEVLVLERERAPGGQLKQIPSPIRNLCTGYHNDGESLAGALEEVVHALVADRLLTDCPVSSVDLKNSLVVSNRGKVSYRALAIATGYRVRLLEVPGIERVSDHILYRSGIYKDALQEKAVVVVGGGDSALLTALDLGRISASVHLIHRSSSFRARPDVVKAVEESPRVTVHTDSSIRAFLGAEALTGVLISKDGEELEIPCSKVVVKIGYAPNTELFAGQLDMDHRDHIICDRSGATSVPGVYCAGDIVSGGVDRIAWAMGSGTDAAFGIRKYLGHKF
ncbi:NAD(P)-binding protein [bacterium]|nr:NAD(P)-binding protein [bacterium]